MRRFPPLLVLLAVAALLAAPGVGAPGVGAQGASPAATPAVPVRSGVVDHAYESPAFGWRLAWDEGVWRVEAAEPRADSDRLRLGTGRGEGAASATFSAFRGHGGDAARCIGQPIAFRPTQPGTADVRVTRGPEGDAGRTRVEMAFDYTDPNGRTWRIREYAECRALVPGEAVLVVDFLVPADSYPEHRRALEALLAALELPAGAAGGTPAATPAATPAP